VRLQLPNSILNALRFDPLTAPGSGGSTARILPLARIRGTLGFDQVKTLSNGMRYRVRSDNNDMKFTLNPDRLSICDCTARAMSRPENCTVQSSLAVVRMPRFIRPLPDSSVSEDGAS